MDANGREVGSKRVDEVCRLREGLRKGLEWVHRTTPCLHTLSATLRPRTLSLRFVESPDTEVRCHENGPAETAGERGTSSSSSSSSSSSPRNCRDYRDCRYCRYYRDCRWLAPHTTHHAALPSRPPFTWRGRRVYQPVTTCCYSTAPLPLSPFTLSDHTTGSYDQPTAPLSPPITGFTPRMRRAIL